MHLKPRFLALAIGLALTSLAARAQDIELVSEANVTFQCTFGTSITTTNGKSGGDRVDTTRSYTSSVLNEDILRSLLGLAPTDSVSGWRFAAVRPLPADEAEVDFVFNLYLVNDTLNQRIAVPSSKFLLAANYSVTAGTVNHVARNVITGKGVITGHTELQFLPSFTRKEVPATVTGPFTEQGTNRVFNLSTRTDTAFTLTSSNCAGFATINFGVRASANEPVFYFAIENMRFSARGDFLGTSLNTVKTIKKFTTRGIPDETVSSVTDETPSAGAGLLSMQVNVLPAKLVPRSLYPDISFDLYATSTL